MEFDENQLQKLRDEQAKQKDAALKNTPQYEAIKRGADKQHMSPDAFAREQGFPSVGAMIGDIKKRGQGSGGAGLSPLADRAQGTPNGGKKWLGIFPRRRKKAAAGKNWRKK